MSLKPSLTAGLILACASTAVLAQTPENPTPGCTATPDQIAAEEQVAMSFFTAKTPADRIALISPDYKQHNPNFVKRAAAEHISDYEEFKQMFSNMARRGPPPMAKNMPAGNNFAAVTASCDIVTIVHQRYMQDPTLPAGNFYPAFTFDTFRVKDGKLVEHWDDATIQAPPK